MDIRVLRYFTEIVREGNISGAAQHLHISQPALSRQIMDLESELGVTLFERGHRRIKLTQEGSYLYARAQEILMLTDQTTDQLKSGAVVSGTINIGAGESGAIEPVMQVLAQIVTHYPHVRVNLVSGDNVVLKQQLDTGLLDFAVLMGHENLTEYNTLPLDTVNQWGVIMPATAKLAQKTAVTPQDLVGHPLLTSAQTERQDTFRQWAGDLIDQFNFIGQYNLLFNAGLLVKTGACWALSYAGLIDTADNDELVFRPLVPTVNDSNILVWNKGDQQSNVKQLFIKEMRAVLDVHNY
ncbi:LysR family transcriptional regulator [Limosilactobacillus sp.]|uniref:LysR family transcriptional regulator n=1 Tax=Limosilactobacillus sp. TaxID=2773925 RepID=UPI003F039D68